MFLSGNQTDVLLLILGIQYFVKKSDQPDDIRQNLEGEIVFVETPTIDSKAKALDKVDFQSQESGYVDENYRVSSNGNL